MTSIAEKYAAQWLPNGEVSLADLIQAAVDEAQSVAVMGEPVAYGVPNSRPTESSPLMQVMLQIPSDAQYPELLLPLIIQPTNSIPVAELATLREKAAMADELLKALELAIDTDGGTTYNSEDDEVGERSCCGEVSYKPHRHDCWVVKARAAIAQGKGE